jgi:hypothetical protein
MFPDSAIHSSSLRSLLQAASGVQANGSSFDPTDGTYIRETFGSTIAAYAVGVLVVEGFLLFFLIRWCCCCWGAVRFCIL